MEMFQIKVSSQTLAKLMLLSECQHPTNKTELSSFLGMINYLAPYIPKLSDCTAVLRQFEQEKHGLHLEHYIMRKHLEMLDYTLPML